jgi:outer membrane receptor protein involved in Fe transport
MSKYYLFLLAFFFLSIQSVSAHNGSIKGSVYDVTTNSPLKGATLTLSQTGVVTFSDILGGFQFGNLQAGTYEIKVSFIGYETQNATLLVKDTETAFVRIALVPAVISLSEVSVVSDPIQPINTISSVDIQLRPVKTSQDILRIVPGLFIAQHAGGGKAEQIFLRGFDIDHGTDINLTVDDMPVNMVSHAHGQGYADLHFLIPETVNTVDFDKGPYFARKGNLATAGFVNFQTKDALQNSSVKIEGGQFNTKRLVGMFNLLNKTQENLSQNAYLASEYFSSDGYFESPQNFNRFNIFGKYKALLNENKILKLSVSTFGSQWDASGQIPDRAVQQGLISRFGSLDNTEGGKTSRSNVNLQLTQILENGAVMNNQLYFSNYNFELYSNFTFYLNDSVNGDQIRQSEHRNLVGYNGSYQISHHFLGKELHSEIGLSLRYDNIKDIELAHTVKRKFISDVRKGDIQETNVSFYLNENLLLSDKLTLNTAVRFDNFNFDYVNKLDSTFNRKTQSKSVVSPKLNLYYTVNERLKLFANSGIGFHSNDTRVILENEAKDILPRAFGAEAGLIFKPFSRLLLKTSAWQLNLEQEFVYVGDEGIVEPGGRTIRKGIDLSARYQLLDWLYADVDANITKPSLRDAGEGENYVPLAPTFTSVGGLTVKLKQGFNGSIRYRYLADRPANETNTVIAKGYYLTDVVLSYVKKQFTVNLSGENIFNVAWKEAQFDTESRLRNEQTSVSEIHFTPGTPFFFKAGISYSF